MGKRGPAPTPTAIKLARGTLRKRDGAPELEPKPDGTMPEAPTWLDGFARNKWQELAPKLHAAGLLTSIDGETLAGYCDAYHEFRVAAIEIGQQGRTVTQSTGNKVSHPAVGRKQKALEHMRRFGAALGLSPADRRGLQCGAPQDACGIAARKRG